MTTQLTLLNRAGAAIGSDTLTTLTSGNGESKTIPNSHKIFDLGDKHSLIVLNSDSGTINGIPTIALVSQWSRTLTEPLDQLEEYKYSFLSWLADQEDDDDFRMTQSISAFVADLIADNVNAIAGHFNGLRPWYDETQNLINSDPAFARKFKAAVGKQVGEFMKWVEEFITPVEEELTDTRITMEKVGLDRILEAWLPLNTCSVITRNKLKTALILLYRYHGYYKHNECELGFVGYGEKDIYPSVVSIVIEMFGFGTVRWKNTYRNDPNRQNNTVLKTWAQANEIDNFIYGFHSDFLQSLKMGVRNAVVQNHRESLETPDAIEPDTLALWDSLGDDVYLKLEDHIERFKNEHHQNFLTTLNFMDVEELATATDTLINIQILSTLNQMDIPTTGGLIELATIDRKNGVRWIRKL